MRPAYEIPHFSTISTAPRDADVELLAVPWFEGMVALPTELDAVAGADIRSAIDRGEFAGRSCDLYATRITAPGWKASRAVVVGGGRRDEMRVETTRRMAAAVGLMARQHRLPRVAWVADADDPQLVQSVAEGFALANFDNGHYKSRDDAPFFLSHVLIAGGDADAIERGRIVGESMNAARLLINEPGNRLTPRELAERGAAIAAVPGVDAEILDEAQLAELQMGLLLGVARGSAEPPRLLALRYEPSDAPPGPMLGLVGKGITFDTGGISIKPSDGMERMKDDMAGGAAVIAALRAIALQKLPVRVIAVVPTTENMPGGKAVKPGDVLHGASGLTVEVNNTDAEGRLVLGDGLWYAQRLGATHLVDVATLTGACVVALGRVTTGLFGAPNGWVDALRSAAERAGERVWPLPLFDEYRESLKSEIADMVNSPGRPAGAITAAMFLKEFVGDLPWAHLDIAGTAWAEEAKAWTPKGATGVMVATLVELARSAGSPWPTR
ncbi:MAG: leucyl aminopeptidase [Vicinamibacterales bacterium]